MTSGFWSKQKAHYFMVFREVGGSCVTGWKLGWWEGGDKPSDPCNEANPPVQAIPILYIGKIYPDHHKNDEFTLEYVKDTADVESKQLHLARVDRSRELWVESLSVFINHLRKVRSDMKTSSQ